MAYPSSCSYLHFLELPCLVSVSVLHSQRLPEIQALTRDQQNTKRTPNRPSPNPDTTTLKQQTTPSLKPPPHQKSPTNPDRLAIRPNNREHPTKQLPPPCTTAPIII